MASRDHEHEDLTMPQTHPLQPFVDALPIPQRRVVDEPGRLTIVLQAALHRFHRDLPPSPVWTFDGVVPGPTIEVRRGVPLEVRWENRLTGRLPVIVTVAPNATIDGVPVQATLGRSGGEPGHAAAALSGYAVVHLHGALTYATSDGWTENLTAPGQWALDTYPNDQRGAMLWYHDHVMGVTRFSVYAGLAGLWIVRDDRERELELPEGPPYEVPLLLQDRNFDLDADGRLTGTLLHKTDPEVMECFGPITVVNGAVWPVLEVEPRTYRFRALNGSNARTFRLVLLRDGQVDHGRIVQIGSEGGLLRVAGRPARTGPRPGLSRAGGPARGLLGSGAGHGADRDEHGTCALRRRRGRPRRCGHTGSRGIAPLPRGDADPRRRCAGSRSLLAGADDRRDARHGPRAGDTCDGRRRHDPGDRARRAGVGGSRYAADADDARAGGGRRTTVRASSPSSSPGRTAAR